MIGTADDDSRGRLLLEMTLKAKVGVSRNEHPGVDRAVGIVTSRASLADGLMLEDKGPALSRVALAASIMLGHQCGSPAANGRTFMRIVAIAATHFPTKDRMAVRQLKLRFLVEVTFETHLR